LKHFFIFFLLFLSLPNFPEGFVAGTQVRTDCGYRSIESIAQRMKVCVYDHKKKAQRFCKIEEVYRSRVSKFVRLFLDDTTLDVAPDQKLSISCKDDWICADQLVHNSRLREWCEKEIGLVHAAYVNEPVDVYIFTLKKYHTFYVTHANIIAHNFDLSFVSAVPCMTEVMPLVASGACTAASSCNPIIIAGACAVVGGYYLYQWIAAKQRHKEKLKQSRRKLDLERQHMLAQEQSNRAFDGGPQKDPKNNKKNKNEKKPPREYTQKDYKLLNDDADFTELALEDREWLIRNEQNISRRKHYIRREANRLGYQHEKTVDFDKHGQDVYKRGKTYITYDINGHKGGFWKMYRRGVKLRMGTFDLDLKIKIGA
jgi:hypothetical protein